MFYRWFRQSQQCDEGAVAEAYSAAVVEMLANQWERIVGLQHLASVRPEFGPFVIRHIDETATREQLDRIVDNARRRCPTEAASICSEILNRLLELEHGASSPGDEP